GTGTGVGDGSGGGRILAPSPEFLLLPPTPAPSSLKGRTIVVRVAIDATGVVRQVELLPSTGDRGYDRSLRETALGWRFRPARDASNRPIAITYDVSFSF
ncbi:MAG: energy transducer TonB, partial [Gemmatimonadetes bacterium]|nr:energy transducer TonB [Gemmatimonadota bacterium]